LELAKDGITPQALRERPSLPKHLAMYYEAFQTLHRHRGASGMGGIPAIPFSEIREYADEYAIWSAEQRDRLFHHVGFLDQAYIEHRLTKQDPTAEWKREDNTSKQ
jgi:hypothetical protein